MTGQSLVAPEPLINPESASFWRATTRERLVLQRCTNCSSVVWYPRAICPECHHTELDEFEASGHGTIYSYTVNTRGEGPYREHTPYVLAYVELDEGPRVMTNIVDWDEDSLGIGMSVQAVFAPTGGESSLLRFRPV